MTDLNKPVEIKRIEAERTERMVEARKRDDEAANRRFLEAQKTERSRRWREEAMESPEEYMARTNRELRDRAIAEEDAAKSKATIHAYPYSQTEPMTSEQLAEAYLEDHPSARSKATPPKPSQVHFKPSPEKIKEMAEAFKPMTKQMKHVGRAAQKTAEAIEQAFPGHLTHRPFHNLELIVLRDELSKNQ